MSITGRSFNVMGSFPVLDNNPGTFSPTNHLGLVTSTTLANS